MLDVECDQQGRDLLHGASVLKFARINPAHARNFGREIQSDCGCHRLVAAHQNIAFYAKGRFDESDFSVKRFAGFWPTKTSCLHAPMTRLPAWIFTSLMLSRCSS